MGISPKLSIFDYGDICMNAIPLFGVDNHPEKVLITLDGLTRCPLYDGPDPPGSAILTQLPIPEQCWWDYFADVWLWTFAFGAWPSFHLMYFGDQLQDSFVGTAAGDTYNNVLICGEGLITHTGGTAIVSWGPGI